MALALAVVLNVPFIGWSDERLPREDVNPSIDVSPNALTPFAHPINPLPYQMGVPLPDPHGHPSGILSGMFVGLDTPGLTTGGPDSPGRIREDHWWSARVVVGYDERHGRVLLHDPTFGPYWEVSYEDFDAMWKAVKRNETARS